MSQRNLQKDEALILVDVQNDFCPGGALPVDGGDQVVPVLNRWIADARAAGAAVFATRDWHPPGHMSFRERGGPWPPHCVQGTAGAELHPGLQLPPDAQIIDKGSSPDRDAYSGFDGTDLAALLRRRGVRRLWVGGLALDYCVRATVLDGRAEGFEVRLIRDATRAIDPQTARSALDEMRGAGAVIEECSDDDA